MTNTSDLVSIRGSDLTGTDAQADRTYTLTQDNILVNTVTIIANGTYLHRGTGLDYVISSSTGLITFLNNVWDDQYIEIGYFYTDVIDGLYSVTNEADVALKIKDVLNTYLQDPRETAGGTARSVWCHIDKPLTSATFPRVQVKKLPSTNDILSIGTDYAERTFSYFNIFFYTKNNFKITATINNVSTEIDNENLVAYYLEQVKAALKTYQADTQALGIDGFKKLGISEIFYDSDTQLHYGFVTVRYWWFVIP